MYAPLRRGVQADKYKSRRTEGELPAGQEKLPWGMSSGFMILFYSLPRQRTLRGRAGALIFFCYRIEIELMELQVYNIW